MKKQPASPAKTGNNGKSYQWAVGINKEWFVKAVSFIAIFSMLFGNIPTANAVALNEQICHKLGNGTYNEISINPSALVAHQGHGDIYPVPVTGCPVVDPVAVPAQTIVVTGDTAAAENQPGWMFNRDSSAAFAFNNTEHSIGTGSLNVAPISSTPTVKFVGENFINTAIANVNSISYDFKIGAGGTNASANQFYMNVYANFGVSDDLKFYDCRYDVVPTVGSTSGFTTFSFDPTASYPVTTRGGASASPFTCPASPADMDTLSAGSNIRMFALNVGDSSASDTGLDGYLDKVVTDTDTMVTTYDFEPAPPHNPIQVSLNKIWQNSAGQPVPAPTNASDITITATGDNTVTCHYDDGDLVCTDTLHSFTNDTINVTETGLPAGWNNVSGTGEVAPVCNEDYSVCTHTVVNKFNAPAVCSTELLDNGDFELPEVTNNNHWDVYPTGSTGMGWSANWVNNTGAPTPGNMELQEFVNGWTPHGGSQYTELDSGWYGPSGSNNGEDASVMLYQDLATNPGSKYIVSLWTSPRPGQGTSENVTQVKMGNTVLETITEDGSNNTNTVWTEHTYTFTATSGVTRFSVTDLGHGNGLGGFVDDASVVEQCASDVTLCKYDNNQNALADWDVFMKGAKLETVNVDSSSAAGADSVNNLANGQQYLVVATGTWQNRGFETVDPKFTTPDSWTTVLDAPQGGWPNELLELQVNQGFVNWGSYNTSHTYSYITTGTGTSANFRVFDGDVNTNSINPGWYGDNNGAMTVDIYPVYAGTTGLNGCVTLDNVPYGHYKVDELMQDGWVNVSGKNAYVVLNSATANFDLVNRCDSEVCTPPVPNLHLIKVVCDSYSAIYGNTSADNADDTDGHFDEFGNYNDGSFTPSPLVNGLVNPSEIPSGESGCSTADGWNFTVSDVSNMDSPNTGVLGTTTEGEFVTPISGEGSALSPELQGALSDGGLWIREDQQEGYNFGAFRCYNDATNGDNLEHIQLGKSTPNDIYCIAYNVSAIAPCQEQNPPIASGADTLFKGIAVTEPIDLKNVNNYPLGTMGAAAPASPTGYPGAWDGPLSNPGISEGGATWVSNAGAQPTSPAGPDAGQDGSVDTWRLFSHTFTIPADATSLTPAVLHFSADNEATAFLDDTQVGFNNNFGVITDSAPLTLTPGVHTLKFAVKNWAFQAENNPTGLLYNLDFQYCGSETQVGEPSYHVTGMKWNDADGDGSLGEGENGIEDWTIYLTRKISDLAVSSSSDTGVTTPVLENGKTYVIKTSGTFDAGDSIMADAQYSERNANPTWTDLVQNYESYGPDLLDLQINGSSPSWGPYNSSHTYFTNYVGSGSAVNLKISDVYYPNNVGSLNVEIYEVVDTAYTGVGGNYSFNVTNLTGDLVVLEGSQEGWTQTAPVSTSYAVTGGVNSSDNNFGNHRVCFPQEMKPKFKFSIFTEETPTCGNGISGTKYSTSEETLSDWTIYLDLNNNAALDDGEPYRITDENGNYTFNNLPTGTYYVREVNQEGWTQTVPGGDGSIAVEVLDSIVTDQNFVNEFNDNGGEGDTYNILGKVYQDNAPQNGQYDPSDEAGLQGWVVYIDADGSNSLNGVEQSATSDVNGDYILDGLAPGCYTVREVVQDGWVETEPSQFEYEISVGGAFCGSEFTLNTQNTSHWYDFMISSANAAVIGVVSNFDFGNVESNSGGSGSSSGSKIGGGSGSTPGRVLGDSTTVPSSDPAGQVLGASTTLPRTGSPAWFFLLVVILAAPMYNLRKFTFKKQ